MFNGDRLSLARSRRKLTAKALAETCGITADTISRLESGKTNTPDEGTIKKISDALKYPTDFFYGSAPEKIDTAAVSFRSFSKMSARERDAAIAAGCLGIELGAWLEERFQLPEPNLLDLSRETGPEFAAAQIRQHWELGQRPIGNLLGLLEANGIRIFSLAENTASVNAFSFWKDGKPYIFLNNFKTAESSIFDSAHELGHLVLHKHGDPKENREAEREADRFAASFLMPREDVRARMPHRVDLGVLIKAKLRWRVSAMAMAHRIHEINLISDWQYKSLCIELSKRGYRKAESIGIDREESAILKKALSALWLEKITKNDIAEDLNIPLDELESLFAGLTSGMKLKQVISKTDFRLVQ